MLFSDQLQDQFSLARTVIEIHIDNLLPRRECQLSIHKWNGEQGSKQHCANVAVTIAIVPAFVMRALSILRNDLIEQPAQIANCPTFVFDGCQGRGGGRAKDSRCAVLESALMNTSGDPIGDIPDICMALCAEGDRCGFYRHSRIITLRRIAMPDNILSILLTQLVDGIF